MIQIVRTTADHPDFTTLVKELDAYLAMIDGDEHVFYAQLNTIGKLKHIVVLYQDEQPVACGAIKEWDTQTMEIKRMYVKPAYRGKALASRVLKELENWAKELGCTRCVLETGKRQPEAIRLYEKNSYLPMTNFGQYQGVENSLCFSKDI
jgi:putative acetyltransferase